MAIYATGRKRKSHFLLPVLLTVILALVILSAVWLTKTIVTRQLSESNALPPAAAAGNPAVTASAPPVQKVTFTEDSMLHMTYQNSCGHSVSKAEKVPAEFAGKTLDEVLDACYRVSVAVQDGRDFHGACHLRMNLALPRDRVEEAFRRLEQYVFTK